jgi:glucose-1-phosphate adenylyltransferase
VSKPKVLALVLAGGEGSRLSPLTSTRAKPALPYAGVYRLIDFPLSNCLHSGIDDVWILQQYEPHELTRQLANGRPWDLDRTHGGLRILHPYVGGSESGWYEGNADALYQNREVIADLAPELLVVLSADHVYKLDYGDVIARHRETRAAVTVVTTAVEPDDASRYGIVETDEGGRVTGFEYKPDNPKTQTAAAEVFVYDTAALLETLDALAAEKSVGGDFGEALIPRLVEQGRARAHPLQGYWRDVGTTKSYWRSHMDLLEREPRFVLDDPAWPILTLGVQRPPARIESSARIDASWISAGALVCGTVERSVLSPGVVVEEGAVVRDSVLFHDARISRGARVERALVDELACVEADARVGAADGELTVIGRGVRVEASAQVEAGASLDATHDG